MAVEMPRDSFKLTTSLTASCSVSSGSFLGVAMMSHDALDGHPVMTSFRRRAVASGSEGGVD